MFEALDVCLLHLKRYYVAENMKFHWEIFIPKFFSKLKTEPKNRWN